MNQSESQVIQNYWFIEHYILCISYFNKKLYCSFSFRFKVFDKLIMQIIKIIVLKINDYSSFSFTKNKSFINVETKLTLYYC